MCFKTKSSDLPKRCGSGESGSIQADPHEPLPPSNMMQEQKFLMDEAPYYRYCLARRVMLTAIFYVFSCMYLDGEQLGCRSMEHRTHRGAKGGTSTRHNPLYIPITKPRS
eukprot:scaffold3083_cov260-Chaetoceros_neogracile.AAC.4